MDILATNNYSQVTNLYYMGVQQENKVQTTEEEENTECVSGVNAETVKADYSFTMSDGKNISIYEDEMYTKDNPVFVVKVTDKEGNVSEQRVNVGNVDPNNASFVEFSALSIWLLKEEETRDVFRFNVNVLSYQSNDIYETKDYLRQMRSWRDEQISIGNMVGYNDAVKVCSLVTTHLYEENGKFEKQEGINKSYLIDISVRSESLGCSCSVINNGERQDFYAYYADNSTAEKPVISVELLKEGGIPEKIYQVCINDIDPENATQMEMFALMAYLDNQNKAPHSMISYYNSSYTKGFQQGFFKTVTVEEFMTKKRDWMSELNEIADANSEQAFTNGNWVYELLEILEAYKEERIEDLSEIVESSKDDKVSPDALQRLFEEQK